MITIQQVKTLQYSAYGAPYCCIGTGNTTPDTLQYSIYGAPWWGYSMGVEEGYIKVNTVSWENIKKLGGLIKSVIKKLAGISTT